MSDLTHNCLYCILFLPFCTLPIFVYSFIICVLSCCCYSVALWSFCHYKNMFLFVTHTIIQSLTSSEMCSLHLTHPITHTWSRGQPTFRCPGSSWGFSALLKGLTSVMDNSCRSRDSDPQPQVTSPTIYPLGHNCPQQVPRMCKHTWPTKFILILILINLRP